MITDGGKGVTNIPKCYNMITTPNYLALHSFLKCPKLHLTRAHEVNTIVVINLQIKVFVEAKRIIICHFISTVPISTFSAGILAIIGTSCTEDENN